MRAKRLFCIVFSLILCLTLCTPALAEGDLLFVAVNDSIPLTLTALPYESSSGIYVPYTAFDASPGGVIPAYQAERMEVSSQGGMRVIEKPWIAISQEALSQKGEYQMLLNEKYWL